MAGKALRKDRGFLSAQILAGAESGRASQRRPQAAGDKIRTSPQQDRADQNRRRRSAQHPEIAAAGRKLLPTEKCLLCRSVVFLQGRINRKLCTRTRFHGDRVRWRSAFDRICPKATAPCLSVISSEAIYRYIDTPRLERASRLRCSYTLAAAKHVSSR